MHMSMHAGCADIDLNMARAIIGHGCTAACKLSPERNRLHVDSKTTHANFEVLLSLSLALALRVSPWSLAVRQVLGLEICFHFSDY